jgi:hypothetical protein
MTVYAFNEIVLGGVPGFVVGLHDMAGTAETGARAVLVQPSRAEEK